MPTFVTAADLEQALGSSTYRAIFDDTGTDVINESAVALVLRAAHAEVMGYATRAYDGGEIPSPPPDELWALELSFAKAYAYMRGDAYTRDTGERLLKDARATAEAIARGLRRAGPTMGNPTSSVSPVGATPGGLGASIVDYTDTTSFPTTVEFRFWRERR